MPKTIPAPEYPKIVYVLSMGGACNNRCRLCLHADQKLSQRTADEIADEAKRVRPYMNGFILSEGEPTLLQEFPRLLRSLQKLDPQTLQVHTNARTLIYTDLLKQLLKVQGVDYVVRLFSHRPETHDQCTRTPGSFKQTVLGIKNLLKHARDGIGCHIEIPVTAWNRDDLEGTAAFAKILGAHGIFISGGWPAHENAWLPPGEASRSIARMNAVCGETPATIHYADETCTDSRLLEAAAGIFHTRTRRWVCGAETNNPYVFRRCSSRGPRTLFMFPPITWGENNRAISEPPMAAAGLKGFLDILSYPGDIIDLADKAAWRPKRRTAAFKNTERDNNGKGLLSLKQSERLFSRFLSEEELRGIDLAWICSRYELIHSFDPFTHATLANGIAWAVKKKASETIVAAEYFRQAGPSPFTRNVDLALDAASFEIYSLGGLLNRLEYGDRVPAAVPGLRHPGKGEIRHLECDIRLIPPTDFGSLNTDAYKMPAPKIVQSFFKAEKLKYDPKLRIGRLTFYLTKGCTHKCLFCGEPGPHQMSDPERAARDISNVCHETGLYNVRFQDRTINVNPEFIEVFCDALIKIGSPFKWSASARPVFKSGRLLEKMRMSGCCFLKFAIDSGSDTTLKRLRKDFSAAQSEKALKLAADAGIVTAIYLMSGTPHETPDQLLETLNYVERNSNYIDSLVSHTSFTWQTTLKSNPRQAGLRLRPGIGANLLGAFHPYDEVDGRTWEEIIEFKEWAYITLERKLCELFRMNSEEDVFHIYAQGYGRIDFRKYAQYLISLTQRGSNTGSRPEQYGFKDDFYRFFAFDHIEAPAGG